MVSTNATSHAESAALTRARTVLADVRDPELPFLTLADMGILRDVREAGETIEVDITPTYSGCPATDVIRLDVETALLRAGIANARVRSVLSPAWTTDWLTENARTKLRENGIAPPVMASGKRALFSSTEVACPSCGASKTERISEFGSTPCKAHYRCRTCREPFEYFKCI